MPHITTSAVSNGDQGSELSLVTARGLDIQYPRRSRSSLFDIGELGMQWLQMVASTGPNGFVLQNGTPNILSWTAPADSNMHRITLIAGLHVSSPETGGAVTLMTNLPDGAVVNPVVFAGGAGNSGIGFTTDRLVQASSTVLLQQTSALTAGSAVLWAQLWAF